MKDGNGFAHLSALGAWAEAFRFAKDKGAVEVRCRADGMPLLAVDPQRIRQIAFNLVGNILLKPVTKDKLAELLLKEAE